MSTLKSLLVPCLLAVCFVALASSGVFAAEGDMPTITASPVQLQPSVEFSGIFGTLAEKLSYIVGAAITLALGLWGTKFLFSRMKSMAR